MIILCGTVSILNLAIYVKINKKAIWKNIKHILKIKNYIACDEHYNYVPDINMFAILSSN